MWHPCPRLEGKYEGNNFTDHGQKIVHYDICDAYGILLADRKQVPEFTVTCKISGPTGGTMEIKGGKAPFGDKDTSGSHIDRVIYFTGKDVYGKFQIV